MTKQEFIHGGLKLIGFWFLVTGGVALAISMIQGTMIYLSVMNNPNIHPGFFGYAVSPQGLPVPAEAKMMEFARIGMQWISVQRDCVVAILKVSFALYLCRGGKMIVCFLMGKESKAACAQNS